ncbi:hypothetical protein Tco_0114800 [Tanacetum coccineum]
MMVWLNSRKHHCRVRPYTREVLVLSTNLESQMNHYPLEFRNRRGDEARIKNTWYNQGLVNECYVADHMYKKYTHLDIILNRLLRVTLILQRQLYSDCVFGCCFVLIIIFPNLGHMPNSRHMPTLMLRIDGPKAVLLDDTKKAVFLKTIANGFYPVYDEAGLSYDSDILSEVHDHDHYQDAVCEHHEEHEMHDDVQPNYVVDSHADYTSNSNMIPYDQYVKDNAVPVVQSNVSSVTNDAYMMIYNDMCEPHAQSVSKTTRNIVVDNSLTAELETYKEQVELYERRARFELTEREQKIDEQLRIVITDRNIKEENLKKKLHSVKLQLASTINHNKSMVEEPALYNGYEIVKNNHVPATVHNTEDTLEIAEITRRKMHDKMKDPECVTHKVKIAPPDYSKDNYLATFTLQKQLTPEQIFWSQDIIKMKAEALKEQTTASRPTKALMVYPPNTPATLVPRVLPTKSQVKINIFALIQLFSDFEITCNKRITPTGLIERDMGFEQTKACYLTEVIPFFKTLKEHFEGIQKALTKEVKEMKEIFKELEAEVDQHVVDRKHDEIE